MIFALAVAAAAAVADPAAAADAVAPIAFHGAKSYKITPFGLWQFYVVCTTGI